MTIYAYKNWIPNAHFHSLLKCIAKKYSAKIKYLTPWSAKPIYDENSIVIANGAQCSRALKNTFECSAMFLLNPTKKTSKTHSKLYPVKSFVQYDTKPYGVPQWGDNFLVMKTTAWQLPKNAEVKDAINIFIDDINGLTRVWKQ